MTHRLLCTLMALGLASLPLSAQTESDNAPPSGKDNSAVSKNRIKFNRLAEGESKGCCPDRWTCVIGDSSKSMTVVKLSSITSISKQTYMLEGTQMILEVTIDTSGNNSIRFYCMSSERASRMADRASTAREFVDRHTDNATRFPAKKYPEATHSHNVEYQLATPDQVNRIYDSVLHSWVHNTPLNLVIKP